MRKFGLNFNLILIIVILNCVFSQGFIVNPSTDPDVTLDSSVFISPYLESILSSQYTWGDTFKLSKINYGDQPQLFYTLLPKNIYIDSLVIPIENKYNSKIVEQIFSPLKTVRSSREIKWIKNTLSQKFQFISPKTDIKIGQYSSNKLIALVHPKFQFNNKFSGVLGLTGEGDSKLVSGELHFHFENLWKTCETLEIHINRWRSDSEALNLSIQQPVIYRFPFGVNFHYGYEVFNGLYMHTKTSVGLVSQEKSQIKWELIAQNSKIEPTHLGLDHRLNFLKNQSFGIQHNLDLQNVKWQPKKGLNTNTSISIGILSESQDQFTLGELGHSLDYFTLVSQNSSIKTSLKINWIGTTRDSLERSQLIRYGGIKTLRGYRENNFLTDKFIIPSIDYLFYVSNEVTLSIFADFAIQEQVLPYPWDFGFGLEQRSQSNHIKLYFAWGKDDSFSQGKLLIKYINIL
jgi:hypothetical protein